MNQIGGYDSDDTSQYSSFHSNGQGFVDRSAAMLGGHREQIGRDAAYDDLQDELNLDTMRPTMLSDTRSPPRPDMMNMRSDVLPLRSPHSAQMHPAQMHPAQMHPAQMHPQHLAQMRQHLKQRHPAQATPSGWNWSWNDLYASGPVDTAMRQAMGGGNLPAYVKWDDHKPMQTWVFAIYLIIIIIVIVLIWKLIKKQKYHY